MSNFNKLFNKKTYYYNFKTIFINKKTNIQLFVSTSVILRKNF